MKLPASDITTRIPMFRQYNDVENFEPGMGLTPDVFATQTKSDLLKGVDTILKAAKQWTE